MNERGSRPGGNETTENDALADVRVHESRPGRVVFTEEDNTDGWIATDVVVDPEP
jgi:hypothetical protein